MKLAFFSPTPIRLLLQLDCNTTIPTTFLRQPFRFLFAHFLFHNIEWDLEAVVDKRPGLIIIASINKMMPHLFLVFVIFMFVLFALRSKYNTMSYILTHFPLINKLSTTWASFRNPILLTS